MELNRQSSPPENVEVQTKATFRKPTNDAGNRKYRRRSPNNGSSSPEGSPTRERNSSPIPLRKDPEKGIDDRRWKDDARYLDRDSGRSQYGQSGDSYRQSDRQSSRSSRSSRRHDDYHRRDKYADDRDFSRSSGTGRDSRSNSSSGYSRRENEYRSRDHPCDAHKYSRDKSDGQSDRNRDKERESLSIENQKRKQKDALSDRAGSARKHTSSTIEDVKYGDKNRYKEDKVGQENKSEYHRSSGVYDHSPAYEDSRSHKSDTTSRRNNSGHCLKESFLDGEKYTLEEKKSYEEEVKYKERRYKELADELKDRKGYSGRDQESSVKKPKLFNSDEDSNNGKDVMKEKAIVDQNQAQEPPSRVVPEQALTDSDIDAAKIAAMKAAELVNRNLIGTGYMSADQKKKLLWGNKKTTAAAEESGNRWDTTIFGDRERQEKFNKLMSLRLRWYLWPIVGSQGRSESGTQTRQSGCREAEGAAAVGFREAVYCRTSSKRWSNCWTRSLIIFWLYKSRAYATVFSTVLLYYWARYFNDAHLLRSCIKHSCTPWFYHFGIVVIRQQLAISKS